MKSKQIIICLKELNKKEMVDPLSHFWMPQNNQYLAVFVIETSLFDTVWKLFWKFEFDGFAFPNWEHKLHFKLYRPGTG